MDSMLGRRTFLGSTLGAAAVAALPEVALAQRKPPFKIFDTHAHFYTNDADKYPFNAKGSRLGPEGQVVLAMRYPKTPEVIFKFWDAAGIAKGCGVQYNSTYASDNRYLLDVSKQYPNRIVPVVILAPTAADTPAALEKMARENRISGVRFTGRTDEAGNYPFLTDAAAGVWDAANRLGLVIVLMPTGGNMGGAMKRVGELAVKYPNVRIVLDHVGLPRREGAPTFGFTPEHLALAQHKNIYYKYTSWLIEADEAGKVPLQPQLEFIVKTYGADQMVWGSDVGNTEGDMVGWVNKALDAAKGLTLAQQKAIFYDTAERIFIPGGTGPRRA